MLNSGDAHLQTTLNRHRSPTKGGMVNRQYGLGNSKYAVILDPLPTGHVTQRMHSELLAFNMCKCKFEALYLHKGARLMHGCNGPPIGPPTASRMIM